MEKEPDNDRQETMRISDFGIMELEGMEFHAYHGCLESEKREGNLFTVDFSCEYRMAEAAASDRLEEAIDYGRIYDMIKAEMEIPSNLLENVAARILKALCDEFEFRSASVRVSKKNPPVNGICSWSRVTAKTEEE